MDQGWAIGIGGGALAVAVTALELGKAALKRRKNSGPQNSQGEWRGKIETLMEQQLDCMRELREQGAEQTRISGLMQHQIEQHETREREAWRDLFRIMRTRNG